MPPANDMKTVIGGVSRFKTAFDQYGSKDKLVLSGILIHKFTSWQSYDSAT